MVLIGHSLGTAEGRLLAVDPQICEILHREEEDLIGVTFHSLTHPDDLDKNVAAIMALRVQDGPLSLRMRYVRPDRSSIWTYILVSRLRADDASRLIGTIQVIDTISLDAAPRDLWRSAKRIIGLIERRRAELAHELFHDFPWLILLQIYLTEAEGRIADLSGIAEIVRMRFELTERWLAVLESKGFIERLEWARHVPQLTSTGVSKVEKLLSANIDYGEPAPVQSQPTLR